MAEESVDMVLSFGVRSAPKVFNVLAGDLQQVSGTVTCGPIMLIWLYGQMCTYVLWYLVIFYSAETPIHKLTQKLAFSVPFYLYTRDHDLEQASCTFTCGVITYVPQI